MSDVLIEASNVSKKFCRNLKKSLWYGLRDMGSEAFGGRGKHEHLRPDEFWALKDISFKLRRGECLGLIGHNGAGKTTLLKILNGLIKPDHGEIRMRGRVGALIALGAGFNPILTGRENIFVNGSVLGLAKAEIDAKLEEIIEFAGIRESIDAPVRTYSSGMSVRLGFAIASVCDPDILLVDEILAVGDIRFRVKCYERIRQQQASSAIILISHNMTDIGRVSTRGMFMDHGAIGYLGNVSEAIGRYEAMATTGRSFIHAQDGYTTGEIEVEKDTLGWSDTLAFTMTVNAANPVPELDVRVTIVDASNNSVAEWRSRRHNLPYALKPGENRLRIQLRDLRLRAATYTVNVILYREGWTDYLVLNYSAFRFSVSGEDWSLAPYQI